jgi:hypothetical protein
VQQHVVEGLATVLGSLNEHLEVLHHLLLSAEITEGQRAQGVLKLLFARGKLLLSDVKIFVHPVFLLAKVIKRREKRKVKSEKLKGESEKLFVTLSLK